MRYCTTNYFEKRQDHFVCANYRSNTGTCSAHFIRAVVLEDLVWMHMKAVIFYVTRYEKPTSGTVMEQKTPPVQRGSHPWTQRSVWHRLRTPS
jgi:hypothetical protein